MSGVLAEHISYLTLKGRYDLYKSALDGSIEDGDVVADLGCGVGVLGLQCLHAGAAKIYGIDSSKAIHVAEETVNRAGLTDRYQCISGSTFDTALPEPVDALVCDHVGFFGIDYGIVDMMRDAAKRLLRPDGKMIPDRLSLHLAGVSSDKAEKAASAWSSGSVPEEYRWLDGHARNSKYPLEFPTEELCTREAQLGIVVLGLDAEELFTFSAELEIERDCVFHGLAGWFSAHLGAGVWMTNSPFDESNIGRGQAFFPVSKPFAVQVGDRIGVTIRARSDGELLSWNIQPPGDAALQKQSTWSSMILTGDDLPQRNGEPVRLTDKASDTAYVLSFVDGKRTSEQIEQAVLTERPELRPTRSAAIDFVRKVLARNTSA